MTENRASVPRKVALVGAGYIARVHAEGLKRIRNLQIVAVVDPVSARAETLAATLRARSFVDVTAMLSNMQPDAAHVLTPPPFHLQSAEPLLLAGVDVLLEKPMAQTKAECERLEAAARAGHAALSINHNFLRHPTFLRAKSLIDRGSFGRLREVQMRYAAPLRQLSARQFGHWMFESPRNLLLEQTVHPLSLIDELLSGIVSSGAKADEPCRPADGITVHNSWRFDLGGPTARAQLSVLLGASFPSWTFSALCDDGVIEADIYEGRVTARRAHASIAPIDFSLRNAKSGAMALGACVQGLSAFAGEMLRLSPPADGFTRSMGGSISAFHEALDANRKEIDGRGRRLVSICEDAASQVIFDPPRKLPLSSETGVFDVVVIGGTGFIGSRLVARLSSSGLSVAVMARGTSNLPSLFHAPGVGVFPGAMDDPIALEAALRRARQLVILAHGGGGATREAVERSMVGGARAALSAAIRLKIERAIYVSSSAALYLGEASQTITSRTPPDDQPEQRGDYARAKILAEKAVKEIGWPNIVIIRPAVVVGAGASPLHSALGAFENETHCIGWNAGRNPLPFVLVDDVADAIARALAAPLDDVAGKAFNIVGDVRWNARRYFDELRMATGRALRYHPSSEAGLLAGEWAKWGVKTIAGRAAVAPSVRDLRSRGMAAAFDTTEEKRVLQWSPCADEDEFRRQAISCHANGPG